MRIIDQIAKKYPELDLMCIRILLHIQAKPGYCIKDLAEILRIKAKPVQLRVVLMGDGITNRRRGRRMKLITNDRNLADLRKRSLALTPAGRQLAAQLKTLTAEISA